MNKVYRCLIGNWERLLAAVRAREAEFPALTPHRVALEAQLEAVKAAKARQLALLADSRSSTRELQQMIVAGRDQVRRLRSQVKADLGPRDVRLCLFGIAPLGKRKPYASKPR
ncbi:MAG TPA: hypothetical protein VHC97_10695 [Thermoanaerobaculia bacterium]|jgi:hypothetical protein|nr:hypothetical protein [Thermoanaerobaculia bacterium]